MITLLWIFGIMAHYIVGRILVKILDMNFEIGERIFFSILWPVFLFVAFVEWLVDGRL